MRVQLPSSAFFISFLGALTSKPYAFQYRTWELTSHTAVDWFDLFKPLLKLQFRGQSLIRILPLAESRLPWISDLTRFNFPPFFNNFSKFNSFCVFFSNNLKFFSFFHKVQNYAVASFCFFPGSRSSTQPTSLFSKSIFSSSKTSSVDPYSNAFIFHFFNIRQQSPSYLANLRSGVKNLKIFFFGAFFDLFSKDFTTAFFPGNSYPASLFYFSNSSTLLFRKLNLSFFSSYTFLNVPSIRPFLFDTARFSDSFSFVATEHYNTSFSEFSYYFGSKLTTIDSYYPSNSSTFFDLISYQPNFQRHFLTRPTVSQLSPIFHNVFRSNLSVPTYHPGSIFSTFNMTNFPVYYTQARSLRSPYSSLYDFRRFSRLQSLYSNHS